MKISKSLFFNVILAVCPTTALAIPASLPDGALAERLVSYDSVNYNSFVNGYTAEFMAPLVGDLHYDFMGVSKFKYVDRNEFHHRLIVDVDNFNSYSLEYDSLDSTPIDFERILLAFTEDKDMGNYKNVVFKSKERMSKYQVLGSLPFGSVLHRFFDACLDKTFSSEYEISDSHMNGVWHLDGDKVYDFKFSRGESGFALEYINAKGGCEHLDVGMVIDNMVKKTSSSPTLLLDVD